MGGAYGSDRYASYYGRSDVGVLGGSISDERLPAKELVLGIVVRGQAKAYPFRYLMKDLAVNDSLAGEALLVAADPRSRTAMAFSREVDGRTVTFEKLDENLVRDLETRSTWSRLTGLAIKGPLAGAQLQQVAATYAFWFAWSDFYVNTQLHRERMVWAA